MRMHPKIRYYCRHIIRTHFEVLCYDRKTGKEYWDYPAMASICHDGHYGHMSRGYSHKPYQTKWHSILYRQLMRLGQIGQHSTIGKHYIIGNCAEQHAANSYMKEYKENKLSNLYFSEAVRPRTFEVFPACENCKNTFPKL